MNVESLESRKLFSVTVTEMYPGFYDVSGDQQADTVDISVSQTDATFTLDGTTYTDVSYIFVHGNGGDDDLSVTSTDGPGSIGASITGDDGDDRISLNFDGAVSGGDGKDEIHLSDSFCGQAYGDAGNDDIYISGACYSAEIVGDSGNDLIDCSDNLYSVTVRAGTGNDTVYGSAFNDQIYGDGGCDDLYGGDGDDSFYSVDGHGGLVDGGAGHDIVYASGTQPNALNIEETFLS
jgi:Ca2+-binding RTX toxin-like protein